MQWLSTLPENRLWAKCLQDQAPRSFNNGTWGEISVGNVASFKVKHERKCVSSSALTAKSSLSGRFWVWPSWLPASFYFQLLSSLIGLLLCHEICASKKHHGMDWLSPRSARLWFTQLDFQRGPFAVPLCRGGLAQPVDLYCLAAGSPPWLGNQHICSCQLILKWILWIFVLCISEFQRWNSSFSFTQELLWTVFCLGTLWMFAW